MSLRKLAKIAGYFFVIIGILGYIPGITEQNLLFGVFHVNSMHNLMHLVTGAVAIGMVHRVPASLKIFFQIAGIAYLAIALIGFYYIERPLLGIIANNLADSWLQVVLK